MTVNIVSGTSTANNAKAFQVTGGEWTSSTLQWSNKPVANISLEENISHNNKTKYQFSCLAAVQHWYDGSTTGQNENYGIMLCYQDPKIADYNSFYSADCTDANSRPALTISYTPPSTTYILDKGGTKTLTLSGVSDTVIWTSENPEIASVDSSGIVTGVNLGSTTINAAVGNTVYKVYTVHVTLQDGVYFIKNMGLYLGIQNNISENTAVSLYARATDEIDLLRQLWRIKYLGSGYYSICPLYQLNLGLHANGNIGSSVDIVNIGASIQLADVPVNSRWGISAATDDSYNLKHIGADSLELSAAEGAVYSGMSVTIANGSLTTNRSTWQLQLVDGAYLYEIDEDQQMKVLPTIPTISEFRDVSRSLAHYYLGVLISCAANDNPTVQWSSSEPDIVSVDPQTGWFTGLARGTATITGEYRIGGEIYTVSYYVRVRKALSSGGEFYYGEDVNRAADSWETLGYISERNTDPDIAMLSEWWLNSDVVYFSTHGLQHLIQFPNEMTLTDSFVEQTNTSQSIEDYSLNNSLLYIYDACLTASDEDGTGKNLCTATIDAGADCVIGWTKSIYSNDAYMWQERFQSKLIEGCTVAGAAIYANSFSYTDNDSIKSYRIYGNENLIITPDVLVGVVSNDVDVDYIDIASSEYAGTKYSETVAMHMIQSNFSDVELAETDSYAISKTFTSDDEDSYVVDYVVRRGQYSLDVGYSILVEDGVIIGIRNNMGSYSASEFSACASSTVNMEEVRTKAYEEATLQLYQRSPDYSVVTQTDELYYDCVTAIKYCRVFTEYETENGAIGAFITLYPIENGGSYEK